MYHRAGRITASIAGEVCTTNVDITIRSLLNKIMQYTALMQFHAHATMPVRVLEIKCPHNYQNELKHDKKFYLNPDSSFKENDPYYLQIQLQMFIHNLNDGHFLIFCKQKPNESILLFVTRDNNLLKNMLEKFE